MKLGVLLVGVVLAAGCGRPVSWWDEQERGRPLMQRAAERSTQGDIDAAIRLYRQAIANDPSMARAHLDVALLYHDYMKDYVRAVYHYERYLELRQDTDKRQMISNRIRLAKQTFAGSLLGSEGASALRIAALEKQKTELEQEVRRLENEVRKLKAAVRRPAPGGRSGVANGTRAGSGRGADTVSAGRPGGSSEAADGASGAVRTYRVQSGDTLTRIALKVYGDSERWPDIQKANRQLLGSSSRLRVGQVLVIP